MTKTMFKDYRLTKGTHRFPNPDYNPASSDPELSHVEATAGDVVPLTDDQFKAFHDKFVPLGSEASEVRDADQQVLENAKARAAVTGQSVDPNQPPSTPPGTVAGGKTLPGTGVVSPKV